MLETPVAFLIFNRPDLTRRVFEAIAKARPTKLLVVADGPRFPAEAEKCERARRIVEKVDWDCEVLTNFAEGNLGCKRRVSSGLDWVFSLVNEAIILEDDCLPAPSFFSFCQALLERYRHDERIMHISGNNFQLEEDGTDYSYYFSKYSNVWGWASWRRAWQHYDVQMAAWPLIRNKVELGWEDKVEQKYWTGIFDSVYGGEIDTWDYQWILTCLSQSGLSIVPATNLVSNIGFRSDATHTQWDSPYAAMSTSNIWELTHPPLIVKNRKADINTFDRLFGGADLRKRHSLLKRCKGKLRRTAKTIGEHIFTLH